MSNLFLVGIYILIVANALVCGGVIVFLMIMLKRQKEVFQYMVTKINQIEKNINIKKIEPQTTQLSIPINEPIAKYEKVSLPDDVKIDFIKD